MSTRAKTVDCRTCGATVSATLVTFNDGCPYCENRIVGQ